MYDILDLHTHTLASGHAYNSLYEMARAASEKGLALYGCCDHAPAMPGSCHEFYFSNFKVIPRELFGVKILMGAELNIMNPQGEVDLSERLLKKLDYAIASLHTPCIKPGTCEENTAAYLNALKNPYIHIIGHPDDGRYPIDQEAVVRAAKENHKLLELNSSSLPPRNSRPNALALDTTLLKLCMEYEQPILIGSDAHIAEDVGNHKSAHKLLDELHFPEELVANTSLEKLAAYLPVMKRRMEEGWSRD